MEIVELDAAGVEQHADELAQLLLDAHESNMALGMAAPLTRDIAADAWRQLSGVLLAAIDGGVVVGAVNLAPATTPNGRHRAEVQKLAVRLDRRGGGIGAALLDAVAARAREQGLRLLWLTTHADTRSDGFYVARGWTRMGVMPEYSVAPDGRYATNAFFYLQLPGTTAV
ncbi:MAG TPA: GNAT family N-acetyltransferase [Gaiellaceae bacterium]|jgi:GNAT superfamily N-acetyltransferase